MSENDAVAILSGMTASGKSAIAHELALSHGKIEIINADSVIVHRGLDIGSAKPSQKELAQVPHHLVDILDPDEPFTAADFRRKTLEALEQIHSKGKRAIIVGGTGFYLKALLFGLWEAPEPSTEAREKLRAETAPLSNEALHLRLSTKDKKAALRIPVGDRYRIIRALEIAELSGKKISDLERALPLKPDPRFRLLVIDRPKDELEKRIEERARRALSLGWIEEVQVLLKKYPTARTLDVVGYKQIRSYLEGRKPQGRKTELNLEGLVSEITLATRQLCKRQRTWFKSQRHAKWFELDREREGLMGELGEIY